MDDAQVKQPVEVKDEKPESDAAGMLKEIKGLIWVTVITIWLVACLILITGSWNYTSIKQSSELLNQFGAVRSEISSNNTIVNQSLQQGLGKQAAMAKQIRADLAEDLAGLNASVEQMLADHKNVSGRMLDEHKKVAGRMRENMAAGADKMNATVDLIIARQNALVGEINGLVKQVNSLHGSERMKVLRTFIENQTLMLNQLSETLDAPAPANAEKK